MNVIIRGWYGRGNLGDELMLLLLTNSIRSKFPSCKISVFTATPKKTASIYNVDTPKALQTGKKPSLRLLASRIKAVVSADQFIIGGGNILTGEHGWLFLIEYCILALSAKFMGNAPPIMIGVGAAKLDTWYIRTLIKILVSSCSSIWVRDEESFVLITKITNNSKKIKLGSDLVYMIDSLYPPKSKQYSTDSRYIGVSLIPFYKHIHYNLTEHTKFVKLWANLLDQLIAQHGVIICFMPMQRPIYEGDKHDDIGVNNEIRSKMKHINKTEIIDTEYTVDTYINKLVMMNCNIGMRLHFCELSYIYNTPTLSIAYSPKVSSLCTKMNLDNNCYSFDELGARELINRLFSHLDKSKTINTVSKGILKKEKTKAENMMEALILTIDPHLKGSNNA